MKSIFRSVTIIISFLFSVQLASAQNEDKTVSITVSGSGKSQEEAKQSALRSAIEQAFGTFISSKTEMFNDQVVADQVASVSSGNIKSYEVLNQDQLPDGRWGVTLKAIVSVDKLTSFVQAKGITIEIKGGMFALNIKQQLLNEQGEIKAVSEMVGLLHEPMQISFDYIIKSSDPKSLDADSKNWEIPLVVTATCNRNIDFCANYLKKTLAALSLSPTEVETYKSLNKQVFPVSVSYQNQSATYNLRKQSSIAAIQSLTSNWEFYTRLFAVQSGIDELLGNIKIHELAGGEVNYYNLGTAQTINFPTSGSVAGTFSWNDKRNLLQIEQMTGYSVRPRGVVSNFKNGGYVVHEDDGHGLVVSLLDVGYFTWDDAKIACGELILNGYSDWRLPSIDELQIVYNNCSFWIGNFITGWYNGSDGMSRYWSTTGNIDYSVIFSFSSGKAEYNFHKTRHANVRAVRSF